MKIINWRAAGRMKPTANEMHKGLHRILLCVVWTPGSCCFSGLSVVWQCNPPWFCKVINPLFFFPMKVVSWTPLTPLTTDLLHSLHTNQAPEEKQESVTNLESSWRPGPWGKGRRRGDFLWVMSSFPAFQHPTGPKPEKLSYSSLKPASTSPNLIQTTLNMLKNFSTSTTTQELNEDYWGTCQKPKLCQSHVGSLNPGKLQYV